jgi:hypothetical protein
MQNMGLDMLTMQKIRPFLFALAGYLVFSSAYGQNLGNAASYDKRMQQAAKEAGAAVGHCKNRRMHSELKTHAQFAACANQAIDVAYQRAGYPYPDLTAALNAKRMDIAQRLDKKQITESQGNKEFSEFSDQMAQEEIARDKARKTPPADLAPADSKQ